MSFDVDEVSADRGLAEIALGQKLVDDGNGRRAHSVASLEQPSGDALQHQGAKVLGVDHVGLELDGVGDAGGAALETELLLAGPADRQLVRPADGLDARERREPFDEGIAIGDAAHRIVELSGQLDRDKRHALRGRAEAGIERLRQARHRKAGRQEERRRQGDLSAYEPGAQARSAARGRDAAGIGAQRRHRRRRRALQCGSDGEDHAGQCRQAEGQQHRARIESRVELLGLLDHEERRDGRGRPQRKEQPEGSTREREEEGLGQELPHQPVPGRAERHLDRQFAAPRQRRRQEQAPDIEARTRQEQGRRAADDDGDQANLIARRWIELRVANGRDSARCVGPVLVATVGLRIPLSEIARQPSQGVLGTAQSRLGRQPRHDRETAIAALRRGRCQRNPHIGLPPDLQSPKARRRDPDHCVGPAGDGEALTDDRPGTAQLFGQRKADDGSGLR